MPLSGTVTKQRRVSRSLAGAMYFTATLDDKAYFRRSLTGSMRMLGSAVVAGQAIEKAVAGAMYMVGALTRKLIARRTLAGSVRMTGVIDNRATFRRLVQGVLTSAGAFSKSKRFYKTLSAAMHMSGVGALTGGAWKKAVSGSIRFRGATAIALEFAAKGLSKLGFNLKEE